MTSRACSCSFSAVPRPRLFTGSTNFFTLQVPVQRCSVQNGVSSAFSQKCTRMYNRSRRPNVSSSKIQRVFEQACRDLACSSINPVLGSALSIVRSFPPGGRDVHGSGIRGRNRGHVCRDERENGHARTRYLRRAEQTAAGEGTSAASVGHP